MIKIKIMSAGSFNKSISRCLQKYTNRQTHTQLYNVSSFSYSDTSFSLSSTSPVLLNASLPSPSSASSTSAEEMSAGGKDKIDLEILKTAPLNYASKILPSTSSISSSSSVSSCSSDDVDVESDMVDLRNPSIPGEIAGPKGKEPTRYGDWESKGRCWDF